MAIIPTVQRIVQETCGPWRQFPQLCFQVNTSAVAGRTFHRSPIIRPITEKGGAAMELDPAIRLTGFSHGAG
jgi:hypothetical protein